MKFKGKDLKILFEKKKNLLINKYRFFKLYHTNIFSFFFIYEEKKQNNFKLPCLRSFFPSNVRKRLKNKSAQKNYYSMCYFE